MKKKSHDKKTKLFPKKKDNTNRSFLVEKQKWVTDVSSSEESSDEENIVTIALTNEEPSLPPPHMCLMAKGNTKVCEEDSNGDVGSRSSVRFWITLVVGGARHTDPASDPKTRIQQS